MPTGCLTLWSTLLLRPGLKWIPDVNLSSCFVQQSQDSQKQPLHGHLAPFFSQPLWCPTRKMWATGGQGDHRAQPLSP